MVRDSVACTRLLELADFLEKLDKDKFNFSTWVSVRRRRVRRRIPDSTDLLANADACGTQACALGWSLHLPFARKLGYRIEARNGTCRFMRNGKQVFATEVGSHLFGMNWIQFWMVFSPSDQETRPINPIRCPPNATPKRVAQHIRRFVRVRFGQ